MGGRVAFTLQAVNSDVTEAFVSAVQSPRPMPEFVPVPSAATGPAGSSATTTQETFEPIRTPNHSAGIPHYLPFRTAHTVPELWREWTCGLGGKPSIQSLEDTYGAAWRPLQRERVKFCRRKVFIDEIRKRYASGTPLPKAVEEVDFIRQRGRMGLHVLSQMLQKDREECTKD
ncbi:transcriptional activator of glycolytic enzymes-domain-containing protein [Aspergillus flavus]|uniref:Transcriptional activator of glycolytic enzymes-domain-containing protein n=2 Tax=Aspergillus flavus TaxID=5059 RepID=B8NSC3_ASPFN|nr:uncharacterized protein G4B84_000011 [Aspergillus flavus NRRL3357]KAJ1707731.1 hypothetical protein NYO67_10120 [Aspergillus flavus]KAF7630733.1 hypothetical protein AFLA_011352 [Aspergillus flavus NRRL3357]QMW24766.1 hypothetical protein G4B84_000011 [Aspergillus flavus NRRL3357]QRD89345.1 transcriptional activator of glycolytic enzymes-domain-containing protein [Aspergillus flavus]RMZ38528.1 hypothetical protein CA14_007545 [Aspergillus flavus]